MAAIQNTEAAIKDLRAMPNGKARNKAVSKLEDALVWLHELEREELQRFGTPPETFGGDRCICPEGAIDSRCPLHGGRR